MNANTASYIFAGNRFHVLDEMLKLKLSIIKIFAAPNSYLEKELVERNIPYTLIESKEDFIQQMCDLEFDVLISNGLSIILPVTKLTKGNSKRFINVHPSCLPDLRGADPVPGSLLYQRDSGATCHYMNDQIDQGDIISQVRIPYNSFFDSVLLHQISFEAERQVFIDSFKMAFSANRKQKASPDILYYTFKELDLRISFDDAPEKIVARVKAFNNRSKGAFFIHKDEVIKVYDAELTNSGLNEIESVTGNTERKIAFLGEQEMIFKVDLTWIKFKNMFGDLSVLKRGDYLI